MVKGGTFNDVPPFYIWRSIILVANQANFIILLSGKTIFSIFAF